MFDFLRKKKKPEPTNPSTATETPVAAPHAGVVTESHTIALHLERVAESVAQDSAQKKSGSFFSRLRQGLSKTRASFSNNVANVFLGKKELNQAIIDEIEILLLSADVGIETTQQLIKSLTSKLARKELNDTDAAFQTLKNEMAAILKPCEVAMQFSAKPFVILVVGINGSGKTTTIGKIANILRQQNHAVMLAAGDTFRAAAIEQLQVWGERNAIPVIAQRPGADTAAVIYDSLEAAKARNIDVLIADTAGRLHTQSHLMNELQKVKRVLAKIDATAPHETLIVLDATLGQNALNQVKEFSSVMGVTGIVITKLDGTAKGGILFAIAKETGIPIRYIGVGEGIEDLRPFNAEDYVNALFN